MDIHRRGAGHSAPASSRRERQTEQPGELIVMSAEDAFARAKQVSLGANFPKSDEDIDVDDIPIQDWSGPDVERGRYRKLALVTQGLIALDPNVRRAFPDADSVNRGAAWTHRNRQERPRNSAHKCIHEQG
jgi:hypothetical protein